MGREKDDAMVGEHASVMVTLPVLKYRFAIFQRQGIHGFLAKLHSPRTIVRSLRRTHNERKDFDRIGAPCNGCYLP